MEQRGFGGEWQRHVAELSGAIRFDTVFLSGVLMYCTVM